MSRNPQLYLDDIREACEGIMRYSQGLDLNQFVQDEKTFDAVVRNLEVIGEAAKHIRECSNQSDISSDRPRRYFG